MKYQRQYGSPPPHKNILRGALAVVCLTAAILIVYGIMDSGIGALGGILGDSSSAASGGVSESRDSALSSLPESKAPESALSSRSASSTASSEPASAIPPTGSSAADPASPPASKPPASGEDPFPGLYVDKPEYTPHAEGDKVAYLTFDDGPSCYTVPLLDVLDQYGVKASFFVIGKSSPEDITALQETVKRGHTLAVHSYSHQYKDIYQSPNAYLADFQRERDLIYNATGVEPTIYRYPGGSINSYNKATYKEIITEMNRRGYTYYDWNVSSGDADANNVPPDKLYQNVMNGVQGKDKVIILFHNTSAKKTTLDVMPRIIEGLKKEGYRFDKLDNTVKPTNFKWRD